LLSADDVRAATLALLGVRATEATPMGGGTFGAVWRVRLEDARLVIVKVAPSPGTRLLTYEADMVGAEAEYLRLAGPVAGVPTAELLAVDADHVFMTCLSGVPLPELPRSVPTSGVREQAGAAIARLHGVTGPHYGYSGDRPRADSWPQAYRLMVEAILDDAETWGVRLPVPAKEVLDCVAANRAVLAAVTRPALVHFDLWDGNVLASVADDGAALSGLVDGERWLYGDPLVDLASPALFRDMLAEPGHPFLRGYRSVRPFEIDGVARRRLWLAALYLYLMMVVEYPSRGMDPADDPPRWDLVNGLVKDLVAHLT
jgi:fructosamine-3-kinase